MISRLHIENYGPIFLGTVGGALAYYFNAVLVADVAKDVLTALLSVAAILAGFLTTTLTVLLPMGGMAVGRRLKRRGKLDLLFGYLRSSIYSCLGLLALCLLCFFALTDKGLPLGLTAALVGASVYTTAAFARILEVLVALMPQIAEPEDRGG